tara:strand:- start:11901 stop:12941 length:1041 start_codon:yes stop_codon:yes gene_type:complete
MNKKITIYDIANKLGITASTVSRALNGNSKISTVTRKLVNETAIEMNYKQNKLAKALKSGKSYIVGVVIPRIDIDFFSSVIRGIEERINSKGYHVMICQTYDKGHLEAKNINSLLGAHVDGIFMSLSNSNIDNTEYFNELVKKEIPFIFFDRKKNITGVSSVVIDDFKGAYMATTHLITQGCKRIALLTNNHLLQIYENRYLGYRQALLDNGFEFNQDLVIDTFHDVVEGRKKTKILLDMKTPPDGIFCVHDHPALGAIQEIKARGLRVPEDISVVGFSNEPFTGFIELSITSIDQSPTEMGRIAAQIFLEEVRNYKRITSETHVVLTPKLIIRKSSLRNDTAVIS